VGVAADEGDVLLRLLEQLRHAVLEGARLKVEVGAVDVCVAASDRRPPERESTRADPLERREQRVALASRLRCEQPIASMKTSGP